MTTLRILLATFLLLVAAPTDASACTTCGEALNGGNVDDLCETSGTLYDALTACLCQDSCAADCGDNACMSLAMSGACLTCMDSACGAQKANCLADGAFDPCPGQIDCQNGTCCPAEAEACGAEGTCIYPCPVGQERCGVDRCAPEGNICCDDVGHPELTCSSNHVCTEDGGCKLKPAGCENGCGQVDGRAFLSVFLVVPLLVRGRRGLGIGRS